MIFSNKITYDILSLSLSLKKQQKENEICYKQKLMYLQKKIIKFLKWKISNNIFPPFQKEILKILKIKNIRCCFNEKSKNFRNTWYSIISFHSQSNFENTKSKSVPIITKTKNTIYHRTKNFQDQKTTIQNLETIK